MRSARCSSDGSLMSLLRVRSSKAAAPSVVRMKPIVLAMLVMFDGSLDRLRLRAGLAIDVEHVVEDLEPRFALTLLLFGGQSAAAAPACASRPHLRSSTGAHPLRPPRLLDHRAPRPEAEDRIRSSRTRSAASTAARPGSRRTARPPSFRRGRPVRRSR